MNITNKKYSITIEGNDLDAKAVQKLKSGDSLKLGRINDGEDTFEISVSTAADKMLDLLAYCDSVGVAPFIDDGSVTADSVTVDKVVLKQGKSRAKDRTTLYFDVQYSYDENLSVYTGKDGIMGFIPADDCVQAMAVYHVIDSGDDVVMQQPYLNMFNMDIPVDTDEKKQLFDIEFEENESHSFYCMVLFDEKFTKCRVNAKIVNSAKNEELEITLNDDEKQSALTFVNHTRIFNGEEPVDCVIE